MIADVAEISLRSGDYYLSRTSHGSTLSAVVHSWVLARAHRHMAMDYFEQVLNSDIADVQGGTAAEGIHLAVMGGQHRSVATVFHWTRNT